MKLKSLAINALFLLIPTICYSDALLSLRTHETPDMKRVTPLEFVEFLKKNPSDSLRISRVESDWIKQIDVAKFEKLLNDKTPCSMVYSEFDSFYNPAISTVGDEITILLFGAMKQLYPPNSRAMALGHKNDVKKWIKSTLKSAQ